MKKTLFPLIFLFSFTVSVLAQSNFKQGYIITNSNDTVRGWVDYRTDAINCKQCRFKTSEEAPATVYYPSDIAGYRFAEEGKYYVSRKVTIDGVEQTHFLEFMLQGLMNLYSLKTNNRYIFFFENEENQMVTVQKGPDVEISNVQVRPDLKYRGVLRYIFRNRPDVASLADNIDYTPQAMMRITKRYHDEVCTTGQECIVFENKHPNETGINFAFSAYMGTQRLTYAFKDDSDDSRIEAWGPMIGGQMFVYFPRWSKSFGVLLDVALSYQNKSSYVTGYYYGKNTIKFKAMALNFSPGVRYTFTKYKLRPVIGGGFTAYQMLYSKAGTGSDDYDYNLKKFHAGVYGELGLDYNIRGTQSVFARVGWTAFFKDNWPRKDWIETFQLKLGYTF
ncbi:hypothetical protein M2132_002099 [Dysgonomonas sp. PH5-45]|uniref:hypothetical protein n=1 Tax=unclassified Dysgonomonas TaxID=2630389 RepID=UPI002475E25D|nr:MULTISPECIES: hypothetical protein [unclassified Dysgonomonas]MDH6355753.1 hypothetical protein [Dysgonomonas sp. PH5-45]MDH6388650.1 hypothetical protein [Dysgonomonas sp. PH5-37]